MLRRPHTPHARYLILNTYGGRGGCDADCVYQLLIYVWFRYAAAVDFIRQWYGEERADLAEAVLAIGKADSSVEPRAERESPGATDAQVRQLVAHWAETRGEAFEALVEKDVGALLRCPDRVSYLYCLQ